MLEGENELYQVKKIFFLSFFISAQIDQENAKIMQIINSKRYVDSCYYTVHKKSFLKVVPGTLKLHSDLSLAVFFLKFRLYPLGSTPTSTIT